MGVDAKMLVRVRTKPALTEKQVRLASYDLVEAFWLSQFNVWRPDEHDKGGRHALSLVEEYDQDGPTLRPDPGEQFVKVGLSGRYYGPGYERGDLPSILAIAAWLRARFTDEAHGMTCKIHYGGDSSGVLAEELDEAREKELREHFHKVGHKPYNSGWGSFSNARAQAPKCDFCAGTPMTCYGGGGDISFFSCDGCGYRLEGNAKNGYVERKLERHHDGPLPLRVNVMFERIEHLALSEDPKARYKIAALLREFKDREEQFMGANR